MSYFARDIGARYLSFLLPYTNDNGLVPAIDEDRQTDPAWEAMSDEEWRLFLQHAINIKHTADRYIREEIANKTLTPNINRRIRREK